MWRPLKLSEIFNWGTLAYQPQNRLPNLIVRVNDSYRMDSAYTDVMISPSMTKVHRLVLPLALVVALVKVTLCSVHASNPCMKLTFALDIIYHSLSSMQLSSTSAGTLGRTESVQCCGVAPPSWSSHQGIFYLGNGVHTLANNA